MEPEISFPYSQEFANLLYPKADSVHNLTPRFKVDYVTYYPFAHTYQLCEIYSFLSRAIYVPHILCLSISWPLQYILMSVIM